MDADTFTVELWKCAPPIESLIAVGLSGEEADAFQRRSRATRQTGERADNPLIDLINRYDMSFVEIGGVRFAREVEKHDSWSQVGEVESDPLVINKWNGEVEVRDLADEAHIVARCASDAGAFLAAIVEAARFLSRAAYDSPFAANGGESCTAAQRCAKIAGGTSYAGFYNALLGCDV